MKNPLQGPAGGSSTRDLQALQELEEAVGDDGQVVGGESVSGDAYAQLHGGEGTVKPEGGEGKGFECVAAEGQPMNVEQLSFEMMSRRDAVITGDV